MNNNKIIQECEEIYIMSGADGVYDYVRDNYPGLPWGYCEDCDDNVPHVNRVCLVCNNDYVKSNEEDEEVW